MPNGKLIKRHLKKSKMLKIRHRSTKTVQTR